ncbi:hypothetical protein ANO11243_047630 [Dothideomycetidae sp. 11243]|nr:hypothetical protein ANO11243_047630 [fungal sp. No.11243]
MVIVFKGASPVTEARDKAYRRFLRDPCPLNDYRPSIDVQVDGRRLDGIAEAQAAEQQRKVKRDKRVGFRLAECDNYHVPCRKMSRVADASGWSCLPLWHSPCLPRRAAAARSTQHGEGSVAARAVPLRPARRRHAIGASAERLILPSSSMRESVTCHMPWLEAATRHRGPPQLAFVSLQHHSFAVDENILLIWLRKSHCDPHLGRACSLYRIWTHLISPSPAELEVATCTSD